MTCAGCNVLLVSIDTLRADHLGTYGYQRPTSPRLDAFSKECVVFDRAYSSSAWTFPAHFSIFTGRYPHRANQILFRKVRPFDGHEYVTLAEQLRRRGYQTAGYSGAGWVGHTLGFRQGFDVYQSAGLHFADNSKLVDLWLDRRDRERPFFLFVHGYDVHRPYDPNGPHVPEFISEIPSECAGVAFRDSETAKFACKAAPGGREYAVGLYDAHIRQADEYVGSLLDRLRDEGEIDRTVVLVLSDHGEELLDHGGWDHTNTLFDELIHVPLLLRVPGTRARRVAAPVSLVDVAPTLLDIVGARGNVRTDGLSWRVGFDALSDSRSVFAVTGRDDPWAQQHPGGAFWLQGVVRESLKLIVRQNEAGRRQAWIFNQAVDPGEHRARVRDSPRARRMEKELASWRTRIGMAPNILEEPTEDSAMDADMRAQLEALGYLEEDEATEGD